MQFPHPSFTSKAMKYLQFMYELGSMKRICWVNAQAIDLADARAVAEILGIPFEVVNFIDFYKREVVSPMVDGYASGVTPNPDVLCNREMKFGALMNYAKESGFDA